MAREVGEMGSDPVIVYDDDELRAVWVSGQSDFALVTFGDLITLANGTTFFGDRPAQKEGFAALGVMAKRPSWYPRRSIERLAAHVEPVISQYTERVLYGGSMGGYGAIKYSKLLGASTSIALCPQWSIDPAECDGFNPGWSSYFHESMSGMSISEADVDGRIFVFSDSIDRRDRFHARKIAALPNVILTDVPGVGHHVTPVFAGSAKLARLIAACRYGDQASLRTISRDFRKDHRLRIVTASHRGAKRHPKMTAEALMGRADNPHVQAAGSQYALAIARGLNQAGDHEGAERFLATFRPVASDQSDEPSG